MTSILAVRDAIVSELPSAIPPRCGISVCGGTRLGTGTEWPLDSDTSAWCGRARCGLAHCGRIIRNDSIFAGMIPVQLSHRVTLALTEEPGGLPDPRQRYDVAYDNPVYSLHIIGNDLTILDTVAGFIREKLDRRSHIETENGTINTLSIDPPSRSERRSRPRYDVVLNINAEVVRQ